MNRGLYIPIILLLAFSGLFAETGGSDSSRDVSVTAVFEPAAVSPGNSTLIRVTYSFPAGYHQTLQEDLFTFAIEDPAGTLILGDIEYPAGKEKNGSTEYRGTTVLTANLFIGENTPPGDYTISLPASYQLCDDAGTCFFPVEVRLQLPLTVVHGGALPGAGGFLKFLLLALIGGLLLNIMPCVLPVLSIKALSIVKQGGSDRKKILAGSLAYTAGILLSLITLALVVIALKLSGERVGWGFQFQNPVFILILISIVFLFALSLFDVFVILPPGMTTVTRVSGKEGLVGSFLSGVFAVLLATPCSAPFLGTALGFAFSQDPVIILGIFIAVGLGLSLPFLLLGIWPGLIGRLPKPGNWMNIFKEIMGFLLLATVLWLLSVLNHQIGGRALVTVLIYLGVLAFSAWIYGRFGGPAGTLQKRIIAFVIALALVLAGGLLIPDVGTGKGEPVPEEISMPEEWEEFSPGVLEGYLAEGYPVFLAFGAKWCLTCGTNERTVLYTREVIEDFSEFGVRMLHGDYTNEDEIIGGILADHEKGGVPFYAFYPPWEGKPVILPEILSRRMIRELLEEHL